MNEPSDASKPAKSKQSGRRNRGAGGGDGNQDEQKTWVGGGNEPVDPDDIGCDGELLGRQHITRPTRSDDN